MPPPLRAKASAKPESQAYRASWVPGVNAQPPTFQWCVLMSCISFPPISHPYYRAITSIQWASDYLWWGRSNTGEPHPKG